MQKISEFIRNQVEAEGKVGVFKVVLVLQAVVMAGSIWLLFLFPKVLGYGPGGIYLKEIRVGSELDATGLPLAQAAPFSQSNDRIYCSITIGEGLIGLSTSATLVVKWYKGSEQITATYLEARSKEPVVIWLEPPSGENFRRGIYTAEIFTQQELLKTIEFEIE